MAKKTSEIAKDSVTINGIKYEMLKAGNDIKGCELCDLDKICSELTTEDDWTLCTLINALGCRDEDPTPLYFKRN